MGQFDKLRYRIARHIIHFGFWVFPPSRSKTELINVIMTWSNHVEETVRLSKGNQQ